MSAASEMDAGQAAFALCELEWMRARLVLLLSCGELAEFAVAAANGVAEAPPGLVQRLQDAIEEIETLTMSVGQRAMSLPATGVLATSDEVAAEAAKALEAGIVDAERALHAAQWIEAGAGLEALARSLTASDSYRFWEVHVERFVATFRGADRQLARAVARDADLIDTRFSELTTRQLGRLVEALRRARGERG